MYGGDRGETRRGHGAHTERVLNIKLLGDLKTPNNLLYSVLDALFERRKGGAAVGGATFGCVVGGHRTTLAVAAVGEAVGSDTSEY